TLGSFGIPFICWKSRSRSEAPTSGFRLNCTICFIISLLLFLTQASKDGKIFERRRIPDCGITGCEISQQPAHDLPAARFGKRVGKSDFVRLGKAADGFGYMTFQTILESRFRGMSRRQCNERHDALSFELVRTPDDCRFGDRWVAYERTFD